MSEVYSALCCNCSDQVLFEGRLVKPFCSYSRGPNQGYSRLLEFECVECRHAREVIAMVQDQWSTYSLSAAGNLWFTTTSGVQTRVWSLAPTGSQNYAMLCLFDHLPVKRVHVLADKTTGVLLVKYVGAAECSQVYRVLQEHLSPGTCLDVVRLDF